MRRNALVAVVVVLALIAIVALKCGASGGGSSDDPTQTDTAGSAGSGGSRSASKHSRPAIPAVPASIAGHVVQANGGQPVAHAVVALERAEMGANTMPGTGTPTVTATTDNTGAFSFATVAPGTYILSATATGFVPGATDRITLASGAHRDDLSLALEAGGTAVSGLVSDVGGGGIPGARLTFHRRARGWAKPDPDLVTFAGENGRYAITLDDGTYFASATHDDYTKVTRDVAVSGKPVIADFQLVPGASIRGVVIARDTNKPVPGAIVQSGDRSLDPRDGATRTADDGTFTLANLPAGALELTAHAPGYASSSPTSVQIGIGGHAEGVRILVDHAFSISGTVVQASSKTPIAGARIGGFSLAAKAAVEAPDPSDKDGNFEIIGARAGTYMLFVFGEDFMPDMGTSVEVVDKDVTGVTVALAAGVTLAGRVDPPAAAELGLEIDGDIGLGNMTSMMKIATVHAAADPTTGAFELKHVPAEKLTIAAHGKDGSRGALKVTVADADQRDLVVKLDPMASVSGTVVDAHGAPVVGVTVDFEPAIKTDDPVAMRRRMMSKVRGGANAAVSNVDGTYRVQGLEAGTLEASVRDDQGPLTFAAKTAPTVEVKAGQPATGVVLTVAARDGVVSGKVLAADGTPVADAWVTVVRDSDSTSDVTAFSIRFGSRLPPALTGTDGAFRFDRLREGTYKVIADGPAGASRAEASGVKLGAAVTLQLAPLGTLSGHVTSGGKPVAAYDLSCKTASNMVDRYVTAPDGAYSLDHVAPGAYTCSVDADEGTGSGSAEVAASTTPTTLDFQIAGWSSLTGVVVGILDGKPVPNLLAFAGGADKRAIAAMLTGSTPGTDASGRFTLDHVGAGSGNLMISPRTGSFQMLAHVPFVAVANQKTDLGTIKVVPPRPGEAGTLGFSTKPDGAKLVVSDVRAGGPGEAAGVKAGDRIVAVAGVTVDTMTVQTASDLLANGAMSPGASYPLTLERDGAPVSATVVAVKW